MRIQSAIILSLLFVTSGILYSCNKWKDPAPVEDPRLSNHYCNDPKAVNYNWGYPGIADNSVCYYPSDLFEGIYDFKDTAYDTESELYLAADSAVLTVTKLSETQMVVKGFCAGGGELYVSATQRYLATVDTTVGDSLTANPGQIFCRSQDTVIGTLIRDKVDSFLVYVDLVVRNDTGTTVRRGRAIKR